MRAVIPAGARAGSVFDVRLPPRRDISVSERQEVNDMAARQLSAMAAVRNTLGDVVIDDEAIEGALVVHNFDVEKAVAHLIESGALTQRGQRRLAVGQCRRRRGRAVIDDGAVAEDRRGRLRERTRGASQSLARGPGARTEGPAAPFGRVEGRAGSIKVLAERRRQRRGRQARPQ